jgi:hypothetical protein
MAYPRPKEAAKPPIAHTKNVLSTNETTGSAIRSGA